MGLFDFLGGGDSGSDKWSKKSYKLAKKQLEYARPIQGQVYGSLQDFLTGGMDPTANPVFQAGKQNIESNYQTALDALLSRMPSGGALYSSMGDLEGMRARNLSDLMANVYMDDWNKAYGIATGVPQQSLAMMGNLGMGAQQAAAQRSAGASQALGGGAAALGSIIAAMVL